MASFREAYDENLRKYGFLEKQVSDLFFCKNRCLFYLRNIKPNNLPTKDVQPLT